MKNLGLTVQRVDSVKSVARSGLWLSGRLAQPYNIEAFEIPIPQSNIDGYLEIQRGCEMPITIHFGNPDPVKAIKAGMNDSFIIAYPVSRAANVKREATIAESAHSSLWIQITTTYLMHLAATMTNATMSSITLNCLRAFDIIKPAIQIEHGYATVPDKPGLGIELDEDALENCRV